MKEQSQYLAAFEKYLYGRRYSDSTVRTYVSLMAQFFDRYKELHPRWISHQEVELYIFEVLYINNYAISTQRQFIGAMKQFAKAFNLTGLENISTMRPKKDKKLPVVLSKLEVRQLLHATHNLKHKVALSLLYGCGLRVGELIRLRISDLDFERQQVRVRQSKGRKDRYVVLPWSLANPLQHYLRINTPKRLVLEGQHGGAYSTTSIRKILARSCKKVGIQKNVTPHTLRHSYATHLLDDGVDIRYIQELLGHARPETTMIYTHVSRRDLLSISSPLDRELPAPQPESPHRDKAHTHFLLSRSSKGDIW